MLITIDARASDAKPQVAMYTFSSLYTSANTLHPNLVMIIYNCFSDMKRYRRTVLI